MYSSSQWDYFASLNVECKSVLKANNICLIIVPVFLTISVVLGIIYLIK